MSGLILGEVYHTTEFKELSVRRVKADQTIGAVAKDLGLIDQTLRNWVKADEAGKLKGVGKKGVTAEQMELSRLRAENIRLKRECEILKRGKTHASNAYFARDVQ